MQSIKIVWAALATALASTGTASAQLVNKNVDVNGVAREYLLYLPAGYDGSTALPVLFTYHGGDMTSQQMLQMADMRPLADANGFLLVYPQGLLDDGVPIWNSEGPYSNGVDEMGYTAAMIDALATDYAVDQNRVYACGYSNGANLVWELACLLSDRIAAVGAVAGSMWEWTEDLCAPTRPVPVLSIHGTIDFYNPYGGGPPFSLGLIAASQYWAQHDGTDPTPTVVDVPNKVPGDGSTVDHFTWANGDDCVAVEHYKVVGGKHDWPGSFGNMDIDSNQVIWSFVSQYDLNGKIGCPAPAGCSVTQLGLGAGGANVATLESPSTPSLGSTLQLDFSGFQGSSSGLLVLSLQELNTQLLGGTVFPDYLDPVAILPVTTSADGSGSLSVALGTNPVLVSVTGYAQVAVADALQVAGWAFSNGLEISFCD